MNEAAPDIRAAVEHCRPRMWAICYRMTGTRAEADDLTQQSALRALERADQASDTDPTGWLLRLTANVCLDYFRHKKIERRLTELVDPLAENDGIATSTHAQTHNPTLLREDVRFAVVVALQRLSPKQRAVLILHDVCDEPLAEVARVLATNQNAAKAALHRARVKLAEARVHTDVDVPCDPSVVEQFANAIEAGSIEALTALLTDDVWGVVDGGGIIQTAKKPTLGARAVSRQWANAKRKLALPLTTTLLKLNGESAIVIRLREAPTFIVGIVHLETRAGRVQALRVQRDPRRTAQIADLLS